MEQKYNIGQEVFFIEDSKVECKRVTGVVALFTETIFHLHLTNKYFVRNENDVSRYGWKKEDEVFASKEELLASL